MLGVNVEKQVSKRDSSRNKNNNSATFLHLSTTPHPVPIFTPFGASLPLTKALKFRECNIGKIKNNSCVMKVKRMSVMSFFLCTILFL